MPKVARGASRLVRSWLAPSEPVGRRRSIMLRRMVCKLLLPLAALAVARPFDLPVGAQAVRAASPPVFERDVLPILSANCVKCHGAGKLEAGLDLRTTAGMLRGGDSGPALVQAVADRSLLLAKVTKGEMPPGKTTKLTAAQIKVLRDWINAGAPTAQPSGGSSAKEGSQQHWAFRAPAVPHIPSIRHADRVRTAVDSFLLAKLEAKGLSLAGEADRATVLRRACFDLWGLPPTPEELDAFLGDPRPDAYERLIDRLLASPRFGQRWARH